MIKFFRHIRKSLIEKNQMKNPNSARASIGKYLIYAFGEILLVVVGILLAIQFNAWTTQKKERQKQNWYLNNILDDLHYQRQTLDMIEAAYDA